MVERIDFIDSLPLSVKITWIESAEVSRIAN
jgi:hypothetical protein